MIKYFTYQFETQKFDNKYYNNRIKILSEKCMFESYKKLTYEGFKIIYSTSEFIHYEIDNQLIRKLKIQNLNEDIKNNSTESRLLQLLEGSKEKEPEDNTFGSLWSYSYGTSGTNGYSYSYQESEYDKEEKRERKKFLINQSKKYNQKAKQYENKKRFCK